MYSVSVRKRHEYEYRTVLVDDDIFENSDWEDCNEDESEIEERETEVSEDTGR